MRRRALTRLGLICHRSSVILTGNRIQKEDAAEYRHQGQREDLSGVAINKCHVMNKSHQEEAVFDPRQPLVGV